MSTTLQICYHGNCFDGLLSAAIFSRFFGQRCGPGLTLHFRAMMHRQQDPYGPDHQATFWADENAVLDFRYSPSPRLTWWCDHHQTTFMKPEHRAHFESAPRSQMCFDPSAPSCAGLLCRWLAEHHGFDGSFFQDHVTWADRIDSARFDSPRQAVALEEPPLQIMALLESAPSAELIELLIHGFAEQSLSEVHRSPPVQGALLPVLEEHHRSIDLFRRRMIVDKQVAFFDLTRDAIAGFNKFIPYYLEDDIAYTVVLTLSPTRAKVSVGSNPWQRPFPLVNLAQLCQKYGGGGHPVVGAVTLPPTEIESARQAAQEIVAVLRQSTGAGTAKKLLPSA